MVNIDQALTKYGICTEALMPYPSGDRSNTPTKPRQRLQLFRTPWAIKLATMRFDPSQGIQRRLKPASRNHIAVMMGLNVYDNTRTYQYFEALNTTSNTYNPLTSSGALASGVTLLGGHATPIVGYDDTKKAFLVQNSWGTSWGNKGFYYMPYSVFMSTKIVPQGGVYYMNPLISAYRVEKKINISA